MTGAWRGGLALSGAADVGTFPAFSGGVTVPGAATTFTKGAWTQATAATTNDSAWIMVYMQNQTSAGLRFALDVGIGTAGSEVTILANLLLGTLNAHGERFMLPLSIAAGTRIAVRLASDTASDSMIVGIETFADSFLSAGCGAMSDTFGFVSASNTGQVIEPGATANTKGAYTQITASTTADLTGFMMVFDSLNNSAGTNAGSQWLVDLAIGGAGSEQVIIPNLYAVGLYASFASVVYPQAVPYLPIPIRAGTRIACRAQCSTNLVTDRQFGLTVYGVRA